MAQNQSPCPDHTYRSVSLKVCVPPPGPEVDINTWITGGAQNQLTPMLGGNAATGANGCVQIDGRTPTQADIGTWIVAAIELDQNGIPVGHPVFGTGPVPLYSGLNTIQTGTVSTHYYTRARIESVQPAQSTGAGNPANWITEPGATSCAAPVIFWNDSWSCRTDKFGNTACIDPNDGTGIYSSLQDCQNNCEITNYFVSDDSFTNILEDVIKPWSDNETQTCLSDIKTCPCGFDYVQNYSPPTVPAGNPPLYTQYAGASVCLSPDYSLWVSKLGEIDLSLGGSGGTFAGLMSPFSLTCAELQGVYNPTVGMTIKGSPTNALGNYLAGSITNTIANTPSTTYTWDKHVIVEVNPAFNSSILNPNLQVIQSTPC